VRLSRSKLTKNLAVLAD